MKKNYIFKTVLFLIPFSAFLLLSFSGGRNSSFSGSPGDSGNNCTSCHTGTASNSNLTITTNIPSTGYEFNTEYDITITNGDGGVRNGFQVTAEKESDNNKVGTFISSSSDTQAVDGNTRITHTNTRNPSNQSSWTFKWRSPSSEQGRITFYGASVSGNGSGSSGDKVYLGQSNGTPSLSISEAQRLHFDMYPNPASDNLQIQLSANEDEAIVDFYDNVGRRALRKTISSSNNKVDVSNLSSGIYLLKIISNNKIGTKKFIKK